MAAPDTPGATGDAPSAPASGRKVKLYDFRRPDKFSRDQIRTVTIMHETFARQLSSTLSSMLRSPAHLRVASVDQLTYEEFIRSIPNPTTLAVIPMEPLKGAAVLEIDPGISSAIVDRLFGGPGRPSPANRELTDLEASVMDGAVTRLLGCLQAAWAAILDIKPRLLAIETNPQFVQIVHPNEMIILVTLESRVGEGSGMINLVLPYLTIEPIIPRLSAEYVYSARRPPPGSPNASASSLPMTVEVSYEGERLALNALAHLRKGTLVHIPRYREGSAFLQAGGAPILDLAARRPRGARRVTWALADRHVGRDLAVLGAAGKTSERNAADPFRDVLQSLSAEVGAGMKAIEAKVGDLARRHEELADQLVFESPDREVASPAQAVARKRPFGFLSVSYCEALAAFLGQEHPQLIALLLSYLEPALAACVLEKIPEEMRTDVTERICAMNRISPEVLRLVEEVLEKKMAAVAAENYAPAGGVAAAVEILNVGTRGLEKYVVESMERSNPALAEEIKKRMFVFEDVVLLDRETVAKVLKEVAEEDLLLSLKATPEKVRAFIWECVPRSAVEGLRTRLEQMGRARLSDIDAAQQRIVAVIRAMEEEGKIIVAREGEVVE